MRARIKQAILDAELSGQELRSATLRLLKCAVLERDVRAHQKDECRGCEDDEIISVIQSMIQQRSDAVLAFEEEGRVDLAEKERAEMAVLEEFLPRRLSETAVQSAAEDVVAELGASCLKDMGRCVTELKTRFPLQIDSPSAKKAVKKLLL